MRNVGRIQGHEVRTEYSMAPHSLSGENLSERIKDFQVSEKQTVFNASAISEQQFEENFFRPQPRIGQSMFSKNPGPDRGFAMPIPNQILGHQTIFNALVPHINQGNLFSRTNLKSLQVSINKPLYDIPLKFVNEDYSIVDGERAHQQVKTQVEEVLSKYNKVPAQIPSLTTSNGKTSIGKSSATTALEDQRRVLQSTNEWNMARDVVQQQLFQHLPQINFDFALSFFIQSAESQDKIQHIDFVPALAKVIKFTDLGRIPEFILKLHVPFFMQYQVQEPHDTDDLHQLYKLAQVIKGDINWLKEAEHPQIIVVEDDGPLRERFLQWIEVVRLFMEFRSLYSWQYIDLMKSQLDTVAKYRLPNLKIFLLILSNSQVKFDQNRLPALLEKFLEVKGGNLCKIQEAAEKILTEFSLDMNVLLSYIEVALKGSMEVLLQQLNEGKEPMTLEQLLHFNALNQREQELKQQMLEIENKKKATEEENKKQQYTAFVQNKTLEISMILGKALRAEKERLLSNKNKELELKAYEIKAKQVYKAFCELNNTILDENGFITFVEVINGIALQLPIPVHVRPEQAVAMYALLNSIYKRTFMQLPTGTGKSLMFGLMAHHLSMTYNLKVAVVVPNEVLAAIQQDKYYPWASRVQDNLFKKDAKEVFYCTYDDFLTGEIPLDTIVLVDEIDALFFNDKPQLKGTKVISAILLLNKYKVIGMTATFRGDQGRNKILQLIEDSHAIKTTDIISERNLQLDVFGKLKQDQINAKVIEVARTKQQELPVVIILPSIKECEEMEEQFECCQIFGRGKVYDQLGVLKLIRAEQNPFPVIFTTTEASLGQDLTAVAYVIQTQIPDSYSTFMQNAGRSNRIDPNAALVGALIITNPIVDIESVKKGCEFEQQRKKIFSEDYLETLQLLEKCVPTTDAQMKALKQAIVALSEKREHAEIVAILSKTGFKSVVKSPKKRDEKAQEKQFGSLAKQTRLSLTAPQKGSKTKIEEDQSQDSYSAHSSSKESRYFKKLKENSRAVLDQGIRGEHLDANAFESLSAVRSQELKIGDSHDRDSVQRKRQTNSVLKILKVPGEQIFIGRDAQIPEEIQTAHNVIEVQASKKQREQFQCKSSENNIIQPIAENITRKHIIGSKLSSGAFVKDVKEEDWEFLERDHKRNALYKCRICNKMNVKKHHRNVHACKK